MITTLALEGCRAPARLAAIVPQVLGANQAVQVRADFTAAEDCLRLQQFVQATVLPAPEGANAAPAGPSVPVQAVVRQDGKAYVFVRSPQGFVPTSVALDGAAQGAGPQAMQPVRAGLKAGDEVAVGGIAALKGAWLGLGQEGKAP